MQEEDIIRPVTAQKCVHCGQDKHERVKDSAGPQMCSNCQGPHAFSAKDCPVWQKEKEIQRVCVEKCIPFPEARRLVEMLLPSVLHASAALSYSVIVSRKPVQSVECQTDLSWVSSNNPIQTVSISVRPGSASTGTQASSGSTGPASVDAWVLCKSAIDNLSRFGRTFKKIGHRISPSYFSCWPH